MVRNIYKGWQRAGKTHGAWVSKSKSRRREGRGATKVAGSRPAVVTRRCRGLGRHPWPCHPCGHRRALFTPVRRKDRSARQEGAAGRDPAQRRRALVKMLAASCLLSACRAPSLGESVRLIPHAACRPRMPSAAMMLDIDMQGLALQAAAAPPAVQAAATVVLAVGAAVGTGAVGGRRISFSSLDERKAVSYLQGFPSSAFALCECSVHHT